MLVSEYLDKAAEHLAAGWCQGVGTKGKDGGPAPIDEAASLCLDSALYKVHLGMNDVNSYAMYQKVSAFVDQELAHRDPPSKMIAFNDAEGQTQEAVVGFVKNAAAKMRASEEEQAKAAAAAAVAQDAAMQAGAGA